MIRTFLHWCMCLFAGMVMGVSAEAKPVEAGEIKSTELMSWLDFFSGVLSAQQRTLWLKQDMEQGSVIAHTLLGSTLAKTDKNPDLILKGMEHLKYSAERGSQSARFSLAALYWQGKTLYWEGEVFKQDQPAATKLINQLAEEGYAPAQAQVAENLYRTNLDGKDPGPEALRLFQKAAAQDLPNAQEWLASEYRGTGYRRLVKRDLNEAHYLYALAAGGMSLRALMIVTSDFKLEQEQESKAMQRLLDNAENGNPQAQNSLGILNSWTARMQQMAALRPSENYMADPKVAFGFIPKSSGVQTSEPPRITDSSGLDPKAMEWTMKAVEQGYAPAMWQAARNLQKAWHVQSDQIEACKFYLLALLGGEPVENALTACIENISDAQRVDANRRARDWLANHPSFTFRLEEAFRIEFPR